MRNMETTVAKLPIAGMELPRPYSTEREQLFYRAYGLTICSDVTLPELEPAEPGPVDLFIRVTKIDRPKPVDPGSFVCDFGEEVLYLAWQVVGAFVISGTNRIDVEPASGVDDALIAFPLLGPVMALLLHQRGFLVLHASAVAVGRASAVFLGDKGAGKSTTASSLLAAGHVLITDDLVAIDMSDPDAPRLVPGFPQIKLAADAAAAIDVPEAQVRPQVHPDIDKRQHRLSSGFSHDRLPPTRIYVLERGRRAAVNQLPIAQALPALIKFSYTTRFGGAVLKGAAAGVHLRQCARLAGRPGVCHLEVPTGLEHMAEIAALIEGDLISAESSQTRGNS